MGLSERAQAGCFHAASVLLALAIVLLFIILQKYSITLPQYSTKHAVKDAQQVVNLLVALVAIAVGLLMRRCLSLTNEAETAAELRGENLTIPRLHTRMEAAGGSIAALTTTALQNRSLWALAAFYLFGVTILGGISSVLSVVFVLDTVRPGTGLNASSEIALSQNIPSDPDPCTSVVTAGGCTYDLAISALSSQLITHTPYSIAGVSFNAPNGTSGIPYGVLRQFTKSVNNSNFGDELRQYCLPVLDRKMVSCEEDVHNKRVKYEYLDLGSKFPYSVWSVTIDPGTAHSWATVRSDTFGNGTMTVAQSQIPKEYDTTIITATGDYADVLYQLMYGKSTKPDNFTAICKINDSTDKSPHVSWKWVSLVLNGGVLTASLTDKVCDSGMYYGFTGFTNLFFGLQGATTILGGSDGYSKLLNNNTLTNTISQETQEVSDNYAKTNGMSQLESSLSQIYQIVQTTWTATNLDTAKPTLIRQLAYPHRYIIAVTWTPTTCIALGIAILILIFTSFQAIRWIIAVYHMDANEPEWKLLRPVDLMGYSVVAQDDISDIVETDTGRRAEMKRKFPTKLSNYPAMSGPVPYKAAALGRTVSIGTFGDASMVLGSLISPKSPLIEKISETIAERAAGSSNSS